MTLIHGMTITLINKVEVGTDPFGVPIYEDKKIKVDDVLVVPAMSDDVVNNLNLFGKKAVYLLGIPKGDTNIWEDQEVEFFGARFRTFGKVTEGIEDLIPLRWNKKIMVEVYD